jgi:probable HAF family extracellular repeat protein
VTSVRLPLLLVLGALVLAAGAGAATVASRWRISDLGTCGRVFRDSGAADVNERGQVVGSCGTAGGIQRGFLWQDGKLTTLRTLGGLNSGASRINDRGQVIGTSLTLKPARSHAVLWQKGRVIDLGTLGGHSSMPRALNEQGEVVGESSTADGKVHAFLWQKGRMSDLGTLGGPTSDALALNDRGEIVGVSDTAGGSSTPSSGRTGS